MLQELKERYVGRLESVYEYFEKYDESTQADAVVCIQNYHDQFVAMLEKMRVFGLIDVVEEHELTAFAYSERREYIEMIMGA